MQRIPNMKDHDWKPDMELLVFLYYLGHGLSLAVVSATFGMPKSTVHDIVHRVSAKITSKLPEVISFPSAEELPNICQGFATLAQKSAFDRAAGAMDGCHIRIMPPGNQYSADYINYKLFASIQMQAICDARGSFLDIFVGYPGFVNDARMLQNSPIFTNAQYPPPGYYLLADGANLCLVQPIGILTPFKHPLRVQERFNQHHSKARSVIERAFGMMKARWRATLSKALEVSPTFAPIIIGCCAFLHNICVATNDLVEVEDGEEEADEDMPLPVLHERTGDIMRNRIAARVSAPAQLAGHLNDHDYL
ncbi:hypothetical protein WMY93_000913 [Mugilogobius chulae]|uniref:DDE Tnp4 domain-containing protein n=1 Tax=Mugilogobius chulae TaxID=88201 RepID=A0AAW0QAP9_9GOBI